MKINPIGVYGAYKKSAAVPNNTDFLNRLEQGTRQKTGSERQTDRVLISSQGARQLETEKLTKAVMEEINTPTNPEKLERIAAAVQNGTYYIPTEKLTDAVLKHWFAL